MPEETRVQSYLTGVAQTSPNAEQVLAACVALRPGQIRTVACFSQSGVGGTATIIDVRKNGVSTYTNPSSRPTLAAGATGRFTSTIPNSRNVGTGDILTVVCAQSGGHAGVIATVAIEEP